VSDGFGFPICIWHFFASLQEHFGTPLLPKGSSKGQGRFHYKLFRSLRVFVPLASFHFPHIGCRERSIKFSIVDLPENRDSGRSSGFVWPVFGGVFWGVFFGPGFFWPLVRIFLFIRSPPVLSPYLVKIAIYFRFFFEYRVPPGFFLQFPRLPSGELGPTLFFPLPQHFSQSRFH